MFDYSSYYCFTISLKGDEPNNSMFLFYAKSLVNVEVYLTQTINKYKLLKDYNSCSIPFLCDRDPKGKVDIYYNERIYARTAATRKYLTSAEIGEGLDFNVTFYCPSPNRIKFNMQDEYMNLNKWYLFKDLPTTSDLLKRQLQWALYPRILAFKSFFDRYRQQMNPCNYWKGLLRNVYFYREYTADGAAIAPPYVLRATKTRTLPQFETIARFQLYNHTGAIAVAGEKILYAFFNEFFDDYDFLN